MNTHQSAQSGFAYAHIFENEERGIERGLFWNFYLDLSTGDEDTGDAIQSLSCDWLSFPPRRWSEMTGAALADCKRPDLVECTAYRDGEHHWIKLEDLRIRSVQASGDFDIELVGLLCSTDAGSEPDLNLVIQAKIQFQGIFVVPANLKPPPTTLAAAAKIAGSVTDIEFYEAPLWDRFRYVFRPRVP